MRYARLGLLLAGLSLLGVIVYQTDLGEVGSRLREIGGWGMAVVLLVFFVAFLADTASWHLTLLSARLDLPWAYRLWKVMMVGEAFNRVTSIGGEPIKAALLKRNYGISYREATTSLVLAQTIATIAMVLFLFAGFLLMFATASLPPAYQLSAGSGLVVFSVCIVLFFLVQRHKVFSRLGRWLGRGRMGARALAILDLVHDLENRLIAFYTGHGWRFGLSVALAFINWALGAVEIYYVLAFLGHPIAFTDAWVIEAVVVLVRSALFFVPANIGTQEGALVLICGAMTGSPALGLAVDLVVRFREIVWVVWGLAVGWCLSHGREGARSLLMR